MIPDDPVAIVEVAHAAREDLLSRQRNAGWVLTCAAVRALSEGASLDVVMDACGFEYEASPGRIDLFGLSSTPKSRAEAFAVTLGNELTRHIKRMA